MTIYYLDPAGSDSNAGTSRGAGGAWRTDAHAASVMVPGDTVKILGVAGNAASYPTTGLDYSWTDYIVVPAGDATAGWVNWIADETGPMPTMASDGLAFTSARYNLFSGLYITATGTSNASYGIIHGTGPLVVAGCRLNLNSQEGLSGVEPGADGATIIGCEIYGGSPTPTVSAGAHGILVTSGDNHLVTGCYIHHCRGDGFNDGGAFASYGSKLVENLIYANAGNGATFNSAASLVPGSIVGNTFDANSGDGLQLNLTAAIMFHRIYNNIFSNHSGSGKFGLNVTDGSSATNDARKVFCDYNNYFNNTASYQNISAGVHDLMLDPQYANVAGKDWTPGNTALKVAFPAMFLGASAANQAYIGAVQPSGGSAVFNPIGCGFIRGV